MLDDSSKATEVPIRWWLSLLIAVFATLLSTLAVILASTLFKEESTLANSTLYTVGSLVVLIITLLFLRVNKLSISNFFGKLDLRQILLIPLYYLGYVVLSNLAKLAVGLIPGVDVNQKQDLGLESGDPLKLALIFIALVIIPPISEEVLYRGLLYRSFKRTFGKVFSAIIISALFGAAHGQWNVAADTFVLSLVMIYLLEKNNSLWSSIALHFFKNAVAVLLVFVFRVA